MAETDPTPDARSADDGRTDLIEVLQARRRFLLQTVQGLSDEFAGAHPTVSALSLGGLIKHVARVEAVWAAFIRGGADEFDEENARQGDRDANFQLQPGETLAAVLTAYEQVAGRTDALISLLPDLDAAHPLPAVLAPWFPPGTSWSARRVVLHLIGETAHHSGHADILRESIDGAKTMG